MKKFVVLIALAGTPAAAQSPQLEQACLKVAQSFNLVPSVTVGIVQSFPELTPPGVRLTYTTEKGVKPEDIDTELECEFKSGEAPYELQEFCIARICYSADSKDPKERRRFEEIHALMTRTSE